jgi:transposase-like protein
MHTYIVNYEPIKKKRFTTHLRNIQIIFTAKDDEQAEEMIRKFLATLFVNSGVDFFPDWKRIS